MTKPRLRLAATIKKSHCTISEERIMGFCVGCESSNLEHRKFSEVL